MHPPLHLTAKQFPCTYENCNNLLHYFRFICKFFRQVWVAIMEDLFNILSSSARIDKSKRKKKNDQVLRQDTPSTNKDQSISVEHNGYESEYRESDHVQKSRDKTGKRDSSEQKLEQIQREKVLAFRRSMNIRLCNKHDPHISDPISSFREMSFPSWWKNEESSFLGVNKAIQRNIENGRWKEPKPIQMQAIPTLLERRDFIGSAPTGSGKSGAFIIPSLFLSSAPHHVFYDNISSPMNGKYKTIKKKLKSSREGEIRGLILAPSLELAAQLHREIERLGIGKPGGLSSLLLSRSNASQVIGGSAGGKSGLDMLVSTPLRLVDAIEKGLRLNSVRIVVLDEADRLLDATDGKRARKPKGEAGTESIVEDEEEEEEEEDDSVHGASGSMQSQSFLAQMDIVLSEVPSTATRALFSATVTPTVRFLAESILRNPLDVTIANSGSVGGANTDIEQELMFVGKEQGKLLAIRQLVQRGQLHPPAIIFLESKDRAQALFGELLYDGIHVDVIHAGRSKSARENAVAKFRRGDTWVLICTDLVARGVDFRAVNMVINYDLPSSGIDYVHRIGRTGRAGRKGKAITFFTEGDFENLRTIANIIKQSGCNVEDWMLNLPRKSNKKNANSVVRRRERISTTPEYDRQKKRRRQQAIEHNKKKLKMSTTSQE